jgi:hypothetical protein
VFNVELVRTTTRRPNGAGGRGVALLVLCAVLGSAHADEGDPPVRAARLSVTEGAVSLQPAGMEEWTAASLNRPLTSGDRLWSDQSSRAELDLGTAAVRLGSNTGVAFLNLDDSAAQMQLTVGTLVVRVRDLQGGESYEVDTPTVALSLQQPGVYRVEVNDAGTATTLAVSDGAAQAAGAGQTVTIGAQQRVTFSGVETLAWSSTTFGTPDELDSWSAEREREVEDAASAEYVASDIPGTQDLDNNGRWEQTPEYGYVWMPTAVIVGWVPYRYGRWVWITPWGWTWVDNARWGYAPFHYGRWVQWNNSWCWVPGPRHGRPVYAPALVAWVGGPAVGASVAFGGNVGWFPLGPREVYVPRYPASASYVRNVNITNTTSVSNAYISSVQQHDITPTHYVNNTPAAVTSVPQNVFVSGQGVGGHTVRLPSPVLAAAAVSATAPAIAPIRQSVLGPSEGRGVARPPATLPQRTVLTRAPGPRAPAPFERQVAAIQANGGRPLSSTELAQLQPAAPLAPVRVVPGRGPTMTAGAAARGSGAARALTPTASPSLAERERALQHSALPPATPRTSPPPRPASNTASYAPAAAPPAAPAPAWRSDRPPSAQQHADVSTQRAFVADDPTHAYARPPSIPVYQLPLAGDAPTRAPAVLHPEETHRVEPPPPAPHAATYAPAPPAAHAAAPTHVQSSKEPRDSAPHGDRDSRDRVLR